MCKANKRFFLYLLAGVLLACVAGALRAEEPETWYLISETELQSIEQYRVKSEQEKQSWQSQVRLLNIEANILHRHSIYLNSQLSQAREREMSLEQSFNEYEAASLTAISRKNGEIAVRDSKILKQAETINSLTKVIGVVCGILGVVLAILVFRFVLRIKGGGVVSLLKRWWKNE